MTKEELNSLDKKVKQTGMQREGYICTLCNNKTPVAIPPTDYFALVREVRAIGNTLYEIYYKASALGVLDEAEYRRHAEHITAVADKLTAVCLPR